MTNEQIEAMAAWTLEDFQDDPLGAVEQVRALASDYQDLQKERDAAVKDIEEILRLSDNADENNPEIALLDMCKFCGISIDECDGKPIWRGPQPEQVLSPADQSAGEHADNPVLAKA